MLTTGERATAHRMAVTIGEGDASDNDSLRRLLAAALLEAEERERGYQARIVELQDAVESTARGGVENATRFAADLAAERCAGSAAVERIRAALLAGATDAEQLWSASEALENVTFGPDTGPRPSRGTLHKMSRAYLALSASHAEARALLADISARTRELLGKATT